MIRTRYRWDYARHFLYYKISLSLFLSLDGTPERDSVLRIFRSGFVSRFIGLGSLIKRGEEPETAARPRLLVYIPVLIPTSNRPRRAISFLSVARNATRGRRRQRARS